MKVTKKKDTQEANEFWEFVEETAREVRTWPAWMRGGDVDTEGVTYVEDEHPLSARTTDVLQC